MVKRGYLVSGANRDWGVPVVAHNAKEAKRVVWEKWKWELDCAWIDARVQWRKKATVDDLSYGIVDDDLVAVRSRLMDYLYY